VLTQKNSDLSTQLEHLTKERDNLKETVLICKQPAEVKVLQDRYQQEINVLEKRVSWPVYIHILISIKFWKITLCWRQKELCCENKVGFVITRSSGILTTRESWIQIWRDCDRKTAR